MGDDRRPLILITGCSTGIGWEAAKLLGAHGYRVAATVRQDEDHDKLNALENVRAFHVELGDSTSVRKLARDVHNAMGPVDVLINNAGWGQRSAMEEAGEETVRTMFEVNAFAPLWLSQEVIPAMRAKGKGLIVNISSVTGVFSSPFGGIYAGTKHALEGWAESMRMEVESFGIDVVIVQLGPIATAFLPTSHKRSEAALKNPDSPYSRAYGSLLASVGRLHKRAIDPARTAELILRIVRARKPRPRYRQHLAAHLAPWVIAFMPRRMIDLLLKRAAGLQKLKA